MKYYENALRVRIPHYAIYPVHSNLDFFIQEKCGIKLPYSFSILPGSADDSTVLLRTPVSLGLPGEKCHERFLETGESLSFTSTITMIFRTVGPGRKKEITVPPEDMDRYIRFRFARAGIELNTLQVAEPEYYHVKKYAKGKPVVIPASAIHATGVVTSVEEAEKALVYGVGRKRVFGFGLLNLDSTGNVL